jgi:predicted transport protein
MPMNLSKLSILLLLFTFVASSSCRSQSKSDAILSKKADSLNATDINTLIKSGYIQNADATIIGTYMVSIAQSSNMKDWTVKQLLDSVKAKMIQTDNAIAVKNNFGKDSVFIRSPNGNKMFIGKGELSFEKMIAKASTNLPENYNGDYNLKINSQENIKTASLLVSQSDYPVLVGNILLYKRDSGQLKDTKIGDIFEIAKRIINYKEFAPFVDSFK